jgi:CBS domain-containing protein
VGLLLKHRISALPVTEGNRLVGMISVADILDHLVGRD